MINNNPTSKTIPYLILLILLFSVSGTEQPTNPKAVYSIPYLRSFRSDLIKKYLGCNSNVAFSRYLYPSILKDTAQIYHNPRFYGIPNNCTLKQVYLKLFGQQQDYHSLTQPSTISTIIKDIKKFWKKNDIIIEWKNKDKNLTLFLDQLLLELKKNNFITYVKVPASYLCLDKEGKPLILGLENVGKIIVEMYGEQIGIYKDINQIFRGQSNPKNPSSNEYPNKDCPKFPSYSQLQKFNPTIDFYIEKTLQQEQPGFIRQKQLQKMLADVIDIYEKTIFYDAYPPNLISL